LAPGTTNAFSDKTAHPKVNNPKTDLKIDHKESHHLMPVDAYESFTEGMTPKQKAAVDAKVEAKGFYKGDNNLNRTDLWKRYHTGRSKGVYKGKGAHQVANEAGVDGPSAKAKWAKMSPEERFKNIDMFIEDMEVNRKIGYKANMEGRTLLRGDNTPDNPYGGNFSQRILNPRDAKNAASTAKKTKLQREFLKANKATKGLNKLLKAPLIGGVAAGGLTLLEGGNPLDAAASAIDAENPIDAGPVRAGTKIDQRQSEVRYPSRANKLGPDVTTPAQSKRAQELRINPNTERGYETVGRVLQQGAQAASSWMKKLGINLF